MSIFLFGLSHHTAPVELRECLHLSKEKKMLAMERFRREGGLQECVVLSTCNRFEVYGAAADPQEGLRRVIDLIERDVDLPEPLAPHVYTRIGQEAVFHLMCVASGLDSLVLGEAQILGQVSNAQQIAQHMATSGSVLNRLFEVAVHTGKRAQTETAIGEQTTSVSHAAVMLALSIMRGRDDVRALVIGAGKMSALAVDALRSKGLEPIDVVNRTESHARELAAVTGGRSYGWHELHDALTDADIVISATSAPHSVVHEPDVERAMLARNGRPQVIIDSAVPRDFGADVGMVPGVTYYNIDDLQQVVDENYACREAAIPLVEAIIDEEAERFMTWLRGRKVVPAIKGLRQKIQAIAEAELEQTIGQLNEQDHALVQKLVHRIVNKVLHEPTVRLREQASCTSSEDYVFAVRDLFDLDGEELHG